MNRTATANGKDEVVQKAAADAAQVQDAVNLVAIVGTPGFLETWEHVLNADEQSTLEAYFPDHLED